MKKIGLICDLEFTKHMQFKNYYYALLSLYKEIKMVKDICDLDGLDIVFIGGANHGPHMDICLKEGFIDKCNELNITVLLVSVEKIISTLYPKHLERYNIIAKSKKFIHYAYDIEDCQRFGVPLFRLAMSKYYKDKIETNIGAKEDAIIFVGVQYQWRKPIIDYVRNNFKSDIYHSPFRTWDDYMRMLSTYRFVLSPLGDANGLVTKFYEILLVNSIPIQQVKSNTLQYYDIEAKFPDCIFFEKVKELPKKIENFKLSYSQSEIWLEDIFEKLLKQDNLL